MDWSHRIYIRTEIGYGSMPLQCLGLTLQVVRVGEPNCYQFHENPLC